MMQTMEMHIAFRLLRIQMIFNQNVNNTISSVWAQTVRIIELNDIMKNGDAKLNPVYKCAC